MRTPRDLITKGRQKLERPRQPTLEELIQGPPREPELSPARKAGREALAALQSQRDTDTTREYVARQSAIQEREQSENEAILARRIMVNAR